MKLKIKKSLLKQCIQEVLKQQEIPKQSTTPRVMEYTIYGRTMDQDMDPAGAAQNIVQDLIDTGFEARVEDYQHWQPPTGDPQQSGSELGTQFTITAKLRYPMTDQYKYELGSYFAGAHRYVRRMTVGGQNYEAED